MVLMQCVMNFKISFLLVIISWQAFLIACDNGTSKQHIQSAQKDSSANLRSLPLHVTDTFDTIPVTSNKQIIGTWEDLGKESLTVDIIKNTFNYREHNESLHFKLKSDSIYISYPDLTLTGKAYLIKDTFVISMADGVLKYLKLDK